MSGREQAAGGEHDTLVADGDGAGLRVGHGARRESLAGPDPLHLAWNHDFGAASYDSGAGLKRSFGMIDPRVEPMMLQILLALPWLLEMSSYVIAPPVTAVAYTSVPVRMGDSSAQRRGGPRKPPRYPRGFPHHGHVEAISTSVKRAKEVRAMLRQAVASAGNSTSSWGSDVAGIASAGKYRRQPPTAAAPSPQMKTRAAVASVGKSRVTSIVSLLNMGVPTNVKTCGSSPREREYLVLGNDAPGSTVR